MDVLRHGAPVRHRGRCVSAANGAPPRRCAGADRARRPGSRGIRPLAAAGRTRRYRADGSSAGALSPTRVVRRGIPAMNTTVRIKASEIYKDWHVIDAAGRPLGRVATEVATLLRGKHKPTYEPHLDDGDFVIVINASQVRLTGNKSSHMKYRRHSGYPGGLRERSFTEQLARHPDRVIEQAVWGMLPSGPLAEAMFKHLKVYAGSNHPHQSQIVGTQRAQEARAEATTSAGPVAYRPKSLRPVGGQQPAAAEPAAEPEPVAEA